MTRYELKNNKYVPLTKTDNNYSYIYI